MSAPPQFAKTLKDLAHEKKVPPLARSSQDD
jgi:hypothetical protein